MSEKTETIKTVVIALSVITIVGMFMFIMNGRDSSGLLTVKIGDNEVSVDFSNNELNFSKLIDNLFEDNKSKQETLGILRDSHELYYIHSKLLVDRIRREPAESDFSVEIRDLLFDLKGPFERKQHTYYDITDTKVTNVINNLDYEHDVAIKFRELRDNSEGIFESRGIDVEVAFISANNIRDSYAAVCEDSKHRGRDLLLLNPNNLTKTITVFARNRFPCVKKSDGTGWEKPLIQINLAEGKRLFGDIILGKKEKAILYPAPKGYSAEPKVTITSNNQVTNLTQR